MVKMPSQVIQLLEQVAPKSFCVFSTASKDGKPNAVPIIFVKVLSDEEILIADNFFNKTRRNLEVNPQASLTFWNPETREGYQVKGKVEIYTSGPIFEKAIEVVKAVKPNLQTKAGVLLRVEEVYSIKPGPTAGERIA
ncbi:MAG: pyridoxamine 5'-phosphate oxidase [Thermoprotei archaeon]|nr:MAG: pyridoxamine 5'-phosphate oxidase [Thermoprotei archaeon]